MSGLVEYPALSGGGSARGEHRPFTTLNEIVAASANGGVLENVGQRLGSAPATPGSGFLGATFGKVPLEELKVRLAIELVVKSGSLDACWGKMDSNNTGNVSRTAFDASLSMLHVDVEDVCGIPARKLFVKMSEGGSITQSSWDQFFKVVRDSPQHSYELAEASRQHEENKQQQLQELAARKAAGVSETPGTNNFRRGTRAGTHPAAASPEDQPRSGSKQRTLKEVPQLSPVPQSSPVPHSSPAPDADSSQKVGRQQASGQSGQDDPGGQRSQPHDDERELAAYAFVQGASINEAQMRSTADQIKGHRMSDEQITEVELQAVAEEEQLHEEISNLNLDGIKALAYIFAAKFGSLESAFKWFDINGNINMSNNEWDTGIRLLRLDIHKLTGVSPRELFAEMSNGKTEVTKKSWRTFFKPAVEEMGDTLLKAAAGSASAGGPSLTERAKQRREKLKNAAKSRLGNTSVGQRGEQGQSDPASEKQRRASRGAHGDDFADGRDGAGDAAALGASGGHAGGASDGEGAEGKGVGATGASGGSGVFVEGLGELSEDEAAFLRRLRDELAGLQKGEGTEFSTDDADARRMVIIKMVADELGLWTRDLEPEGSGMFVGNLADFVEQTRRRLAAIDPGGSHEFEKELNSTQRQVVNWLAAGMDRFTITQGRGADRQVVAFNVGEFAAEVRRRLAALKPGETDSFEPGLSSGQRRVVHLIAEELGMWTSSEGTGSERFVTVFNLKDFAEEVRRTLQALQPGETHDFPSSLTNHQRKVVHLTATEFGHVSGSQENDQGERYVSVANLSEFRGQVRSELEVMDDGESKAVGMGKRLSLLQLKAVRLMADELGMDSQSKGDGDELQVTTPAARSSSMMGLDGIDEDEGELPRKNSSSRSRTMKDKLDDLETEADQIGALFDTLATGWYNGQKLFTRFIDLKTLADEMREVMPSQHRKFKKIEAMLESLFEDTMQLQVDFGTRTTKGLTRQWFQTFLQKVARKSDLSVFGLLLHLFPEDDD